MKILSKKEWESAMKAQNGDTIINESHVWADTKKPVRAGYIFVPVDKPWKWDIEKVLIRDT